MWILSDEEMIKIQNRMSDLWEEQDDIEESARCVDRLLGTLDTLMTSDHYYSAKDIPYLLYSK